MNPAGTPRPRLPGLRKRAGPTRAELIQRKHSLEGQINGLAAELKRLTARGKPTQSIEASLDRLRSRHYQTRLEIDRTGAE